MPSRVACLRQCLPTIPGIHQFSRCCSRTSAYETHCRATGRWLGLLCFYTSLVISLSFSLAPFIPCPCCLGSSLAGRVKFTNPYGAPRATSAPVLVLTSKIRLAPSFSSLFVVFQTAFCNRLSLFSFTTAAYVFIYLAESFYLFCHRFPSEICLPRRLTCCSLSASFIPTIFQQWYRPILQAIKRQKAAGCKTGTLLDDEEEKKATFSEERLAEILCVEATFESAR